MRQVCINERQEVVVVEIPVPTVSPGQLLVRTGYSIISSGTETTAASSPALSPPARLRQSVNLLQKFSGSLKREGVASTLKRVRQRLHPPSHLQGSGYSAAGEIIEVGEGIEDFQVGDMVACGGGSANHAEFISLPRNLVSRVPAEVSLREACFTTLGAIAMQGVRRAEVSFGEVVVVVGLGLIGQMVSQLAQAAGCIVIAVDLMDERLDLAKGLGAHQTINAKTEDAVQAVYRMAGDHGVDAVLICAATGSSGPVNDAFRMCRERGRVIIVGDVGMNLERTQFYRKELDLLISRSYGPGRYDDEYEQLGIDYPIGYVRWTENRNMNEFLRLLAEGKVRVAPLISAEYELGEAARAYSDLASKSEKTLGVLFRYETANQTENRSRAIHLKRTVTEGRGERVRFAVIGAGSFARGFHIPNICKIQDSELIAIANFTGVNARQAAEEFGAAYCTTDYREVLADKNIDAVAITTRHHLHAEMALAAAQNGKHVFVEKPLALTLEECQQIRQAVAEAGVLLTIGFNRRFAPLAIKLKELLDNAPGPKMITYRVNAGWLPPDHWTLDPLQGGGRILGEGCHFFDLLYYLVGAEPVRIAASLARSTEAEVKDNANLSASVEFADGSVGTLIYTVVGHKDLAKERIEAFAGGKAFVMDNFDSLIAYGEQLAKAPAAPANKGHLELMQHFCSAVLGKTQLEITADDGLRAQACALKALESARTGRFCDLRMGELLESSGSPSEKVESGFTPHLR